MYQKNEGPRAGSLRRLYEEFARYYMEERCRWAPTNPKRVFNLAFEVVYPDFHGRLTPEEFLAEMYAVLGFRGSQPEGLFQTFDPTKYTCSLPLQNHFVNLFRARLRWRLLDQFRRLAKWRQKLNPAELTHEAEERRLERVADLPEGLSLLSSVEFAVVHMTYWGRYSHREVAVELGMDRETVRRRHDSALLRLRAFYGVGEKIAA
jgi:hypothetical protein